MFPNNDATPQPDMQGEPGGRGIPQVGRKRKANKYLLLLAMGIGVTAAIAMGAHSVLEKLRHRNEGKSKTPNAQRGLPDLTRDAFDAKNAPPPPPGAPFVMTGNGNNNNAQKAAMDLEERRKRAPLRALGLASGNGDSPNAAVLSGSQAGGVRPTSSLSGALSATRMAEATASQLRDPDLTLTQGSFLDCTLVTAINSQQPGMTSCVLNRNIYSTNGRVLLLERGSRVVGQYQSAQLRQGMDRIFVLWTRAETPNGVIINLDSPNTDALGRSGMEGDINQHFWQRFGAAMLVSVVDDAAQYAANSNRQNNGGNVYNFGNTTGAARNAASIIVENTVNIPPTLERGQGGHVGIFVARDLYFGSVYSLAPRNSAP
jgi:type IV secretion system protein VirB10